MGAGDAILYGVIACAFDAGARARDADLRHPTGQQRAAKASIAAEAGSQLPVAA